MPWGAIVKILLSLVVHIIKNNMDAKQRKEIAADVDKASAMWTDAYVTDRLQSGGFYRDDTGDSGK